MQLIPEAIRQYFPSVILKRQKKALRDEVAHLRHHFHPSEAATQSAAVVARIEQMVEFQTAKIVLLYYPKGTEVDLRPLLEKYRDSKTLLLPVTHRHGMEAHPYLGEEHMVVGKFGIKEPDTPTYIGPVDLVLAPGVAFDDRCYRIGRGGGYYDRYLERLVGGIRMGVGFDYQLVDEVPHGYFDQRLDAVITPHRTIVRD